MLWPQGFNLDAYKAVIASSDIWIGFRNSIIYVVAGTTLSVVLTVLLAYPLSKSQLWGRKPLMLLISVTMFFSGGLMPSYILISKIFGYRRNHAGHDPARRDLHHNMLMMRTYFQGLPKELEESAQIDGASSMKVLIKIILPLSPPSVAVIALFSGWDLERMVQREPVSVPAEICGRGAVYERGSGSGQCQFRAVTDVGAAGGPVQSQAREVAEDGDDGCFHSADPGSISVCTEILHPGRRDGTIKE